MHKRSRAVWAALMLGLVAAPTLAAKPVPEARQTDAKHFAIDFPQAMQSWDNQELAATLSPGDGATCHWDSDTRLACTTETALRLATAYRVGFAQGLKTQHGNVLGPLDLRFETRRPRLYASIRQWTQGLPEIELTADMPVDAASLRSSLGLALDGQVVPIAGLRPLPPRWKNDSATRYRLDLPPLEGADRELRLRLRPGLRANEGELPGIQDEVLARMLVKPTFALRGLTCADANGTVKAANSNGLVEATCLPGEPVQLVFSENLDYSSRQRVERVFAAVAAPFAASPVNPSWWTGGTRFSESGMATPGEQWGRLGTLPPASEIAFDLGAAVHSASGAALPPVRIRIRTSDDQPQMRARHRQSLIANGRNPPVLLEAVNAVPAELEVRGVGASDHHETLAVTTGRHDNRPRPVVSVETTKALAEGGWVRWTPQEPEAGPSHHYQTPASVEIAAPGFDLMAVAGRREVLVWANEWERDAPVAGAEIELLWREDEDAPSRIAARARTGADGVALLRLPDDLIVPPAADGSDDGEKNPSWQVRAIDALESDPGRAVLPIGDPSGFGSVELGHAVPRRMWGVTDRPLYRAGETVRYRLWQRDQDGAQLRTPGTVDAVTLRLHDDGEDRVVREWLATPAKDGGISGELALPVHLTDGTYCIGIEKHIYGTQGACFFVGTHRSQDLWAELKTRGGVLHDGDRFVADLKAGYFSGGPAAGMVVDRFDVTLWPVPLEEAYPQFADYEFIDLDDADDMELEPADSDEDLELDGTGALRMTLPVRFDDEENARPAFGILAIDAEVKPDDREGTVASDETTRYARYLRYVGLKTNPIWFSARDKVSVEGIVITDGGKPVHGAAIDVTIDYLPGFHGEGVPERVGHCGLRSGTGAPCDFPRARSGRYRLTASSGKAAPVTIERYVWSDDENAEGGEEVEPDLVTVDRSPRRDAPVRLLLTQPHERARALFVVASGGAILGHHIESVREPVATVAVPVSPQWRNELTVRAYVRDAVASQSADGYREPVEVTELETSIHPLDPEPGKPAVTVAFQSPTATPGAQATITLHNRSAQPRAAVLAVMDDALRAQAQRWLPYADPHGPEWLGGALLRGEGDLEDAGFHEWNAGAWRWLLPVALDNVAPDPAPLPPPPAQPAIAAEAPSPVDSPEGMTLDRVEITGSRISRADMEPRDSKAPDPSLRLERQRTAAGPRSDAAAMLRTHFADTAMWLPDLHLAPGESRTITLDLPDNLTRWRAVVWSSDDGDGFAMSDAALEVGLPVEARLQVPVRLYPGDESRVATSVRHTAPHAATALTTLRIEGVDGADEQQQSVKLRARGQASAGSNLSAENVGELRLTATAQTAAGRDAVADAIEVASPMISGRKLQAGWIGGSGLSLDVPALPEGARDARLQVSLLRGGAGMTSQWIQDLHEYPHRCWEQILSRSVAAALAIERGDPRWSDADKAIAEALDNAAVFQGNDGRFRYFPGSPWRPETADSGTVLTAYTLRVFDLLQSLGHPVPGTIREQARQYLAGVARVPATGAAATAVPTPVDTRQLAVQAYAAAAHAPQANADLDRLWTHWEKLSLPVQVASAQAFARAGHSSAAPAVQRVLGQAPLRGEARSLRLPGRYDHWMSSNLREQCALIELLREYPQLAAPPTRRQLLRGISDLYGGGTGAVDTQSGAVCLMALRDTDAGLAEAPGRATFTAGDQTRRLELQAHEERIDWMVGAPQMTELKITGVDDTQPAMSYVASLSYEEDARSAAASAVGLALERRYAVLRDGDWRPTEGVLVREGDWIRISLAVHSTMPRYFVAVTDSVPGGLRPTDLELSAVAGGDLLKVGSEGSQHFATRKLDPRSPRFYAEYLPAGRHELHYFARVGNAGDYLAAPATAELMYGSATYARTAAERLRFETAE